MPVVYILRCADNTLYVGHTDDLASREKTHNAGRGAGYTAARLPVRIVYSEKCDSETAAIQRERQLKRWSGKKKEALINGDVATLKGLSRCRRPKRSRN
jgi:predicted GIY-YIG superfamily endonuclease